MPLKPLSPNALDTIKVLLIGQTGAGKTKSAGTVVAEPDGNGGLVPSGEKVLMLSAESGLLSIRNEVQGGLVEGVEIRSWPDAVEALDMVQRSQQARDRYGWIYIDSLTELCGRCVEHFQEKYPSRSDSFPMWMEYTDSMIRLVKGFRDLSDFSVVFTSLIDSEKDEVGRRHYGPLVSGTRFKQLLPSFFDEVFYLVSLPDDQGVQRRGYITGSWQQYPGKDRSGVLDLFEAPDLLHISRKITGRTSAAQTPATT